MAKERFPSRDDDYFLTEQQVLVWFQISKTLLDNWIKDGMFPKPYVLGRLRSESGQCRRWSKWEILDWIDEEIRLQRDEEAYRARRKLVPRRYAPIGKDIYLSVQEVCGWLGVSTTLIYDKLARGDLPDFDIPMVVGDNIQRWHRSTIENWISERKREGIPLEQRLTRNRPSRMRKDALPEPDGGDDDP